MRTSFGPTRCVQNIEASVFWRLLVIFPVGVAIRIQHVVACFVALATRWLALSAFAAMAVNA